MLCKKNWGSSPRHSHDLCGVSNDLFPAIHLGGCECCCRGGCGKQAWGKFLNSQFWGKPFWLVVSTHLKNITQNGNLPQIGVKRKNLWNHHLALHGQNGLPGFSQKKHALNATTRLKSYFTKASHNASPKLARLSTSSHVVEIAWKAIDQEVRLAFLLPRTHGLHT